MIHFRVEGAPVPKQSFRASSIRPFTQERVREWERAVGWSALAAMHGGPVIIGPVAVRIVFYRKDARLGDIDNLSKGTLDGMKGVVMKDDRQVQALWLVKVLGARPGCEVWVWELPVSVKGDLTSL